MHPCVSIRGREKFLPGSGIAHAFSKGRILSLYSRAYSVLRERERERGGMPSKRVLLLFRSASLPLASVLFILSSRFSLLLFFLSSFFFLLSADARRRNDFSGLCVSMTMVTEQCAGLIPSAYSLVRNRGEGKIAVSPPADPLRRRFPGESAGWTIIGGFAKLYTRRDEGASRLVEMSYRGYPARRWN